MRLTNARSKSVLCAAVMCGLLGASLVSAQSRTGNIYSYMLDGVRYYSSTLPADPRATDIKLIGTFAPKVLLSGSPSILAECMDPPMGDGVLRGPSARARECTRLLCSKPVAVRAVEHYALRKPQSAAADQVALTCITRSEQDRKAR